MHEGMAPEEAGVEVATALMLRQLYVLVEKLHGVGTDGLAAWREEIVLKLEKSFAETTGSTFSAATLKSALETVDGVFNGITHPR